MGFAIPFPAISGAVPPLGSKRPKRPVAVSLVPRLALGSIPRDPVIIRHFVAEDIAEEILREHHIETARGLDELHRRVVDVKVIHLHIGILLSPLH
jgi:hypothetical protein